MDKNTHDQEEYSVIRDTSIILNKLLGKTIKRFKIVEGKEQYQEIDQILIETDDCNISISADWESSVWIKEIK